MKTFAISALIAAVGAIQHHHHHHHPSTQALLQDDPTCTTSQETGHCLMTHYKDEGKSDHPIDYFVPNFGVDHDIKANNENLAWSEAQLSHKLVIPKTTAIRENEDVPPIQMPANRVLDADVKTTLANSKAAEESLDHKWNIVWN